MQVSTYHLCLECNREFVNELNIAVCPKCLKKEKKKFKKGTPSKYETVNRYLREELDV